MQLLWLPAGLLVAGIVYQLLGARRDRRRFAAPGRFVAMRGHRLHLVCGGSGAPPVLFESGIAASSLSWSLVLPRVQEFTRACAYDRAGLAWSDPPSCPRTIDAIVDDLAAVVDAVGPRDRWILAGHSFGSYVIRAYAVRHPVRVAALVLVDPPTEWTAARTERQRRMLWGARHLSTIGGWLARAGVVRACLALLAGGVPSAPRGFVKVFGATAARTLERLVGEVRKLPAEVHPVVQALWCQPKCFRSMAEHLHALEREGPSLAAVSPPSHIPCVVISSGGLADEQLTAHRRLAEAAERGRHVVAARSAHWVQFDEPELIVETVRTLIKEIGSGS